MDTEKIFETRVEFAVEQGGTDVLANIVNGGILVGIFWPVVEHYQLITWFVLLVIGGTMRLLISLPMSRVWLRLNNPRKWFRIYNPLTVLFGITWGLSGYLFFVPDQIGYQLFLSILLVGMVAGSVGSLPVFLSVFYFFMFSLILPITIMLLSEPHRLAFGMGLLCVVFMIYSSVAGWKSHAMISDALSVRFKTEALARLDPLTEIMNRRALDDALFVEFGRARRNNTPITFALCDIDYFKLVNDNLGHLAGDAILRKVAKSLAFTLARPTDCLARYGGEEFAIVLSETPSAGAAHVIERVRAGVENLQIEHPSSTYNQFVTISIGVYTVIPDESLIIEDVISRADQALYKAKELGRNQVIHYSEISVV